MDRTAGVTAALRTDIDTLVEDVALAHGATYVLRAPLVAGGRPVSRHPWGRHTDSRLMRTCLDFGLETVIGYRVRVGQCAVVVCA